MMKHSPSKNFRIPSSIFVVLYIAFATITIIACSNSETMGIDIREQATAHCKDTDADFSPTQEKITTTNYSLKAEAAIVESTSKDSIHPNDVAETTTKNDFLGTDTSITEPTSMDSMYTNEIVCDTIKNNLSLDDTEYPYAGIPRIVIETENHQAVKDRETEIPAKLQIWGENTPESDIMKLTIRGRGNSSWFSMEKKSYKIEFTNKHEILGMPTNRDWALISNNADKTLMRNYLIYKIAPTVGAAYAPRCVQTELYLNGEYLGVYLLTETIKIGKNRVNIPDTEDSYIVEFDGKYGKNEQVVFSNVIKEKQPFRIHSPHNAPSEIVNKLTKHVEDFEVYLKDDLQSNELQLEDWIDIDEYIVHYWLQELAKNPDANFFTSVYFSWTTDGKIVMGPVWDFDVAFGNYEIESLNTPANWHIRGTYWNMFLFQSNYFKKQSNAFWKENSTRFATLLDSIETQRQFLKKAAQNNFKRWNVLEKTATWALPKAYHSYNEAVDSLKNWLEKRIEWIDSQIN